MATSVIAPMLGKVLKIEKNVGEPVEEDDVVVVLEAMKMEIPVVAPTAGVIKAVLVTPGQAVEAEETLAEIE
ncbi:MAG TPA: biotin/lipoyl-containing protein [Candidatus Binatia bacterium]|nr:biotin/lipoyl-containing protein [Candidatus Binatia bacterium]